MPPSGRGGRHRGPLGLAIALAHVYADPSKELEHLRRDRSSARDRGAHPHEPELLAQRTEREEVADEAPARERRPPEHALHAAGVGHADLDGREHLLPHPRDAQEHGRLHLAHVGRERLAAGPEVDDVARLERAEHREEPLRDVAERQVGEDLVARSCPVRVAKDPGRVEHIRVREHGALGRPGGAGRVDDDRRLLRVELRRGRRQVERLRVLQLLPAARVSVADAARVHDEDVGQVRQVRPNGERLVHLLLVLGDQELRARVAHEVLELGGRARRVDAYDDRADRLRGDVGNEPLRPVLGLDRDPVARSDPAPAQAGGDARDALLVVGPRPLLPAA